MKRFNNLNTYINSDKVNQILYSGDLHINKDAVSQPIDKKLITKGVEDIYSNENVSYNNNESNKKEAKEISKKVDIRASNVLLSRAQFRNVNKLNNIINNNLTDMDFSGTLADLQGDPIPNPKGGYWDHLTEMKQSYSGLQDIKKGLEGSLNNPNLNQNIREVLQNNLDNANFYINKIEELFKPFGGIK